MHRNDLWLLDTELWTWREVHPLWNLTDTSLTSQLKLKLFCFFQIKMFEEGVCCVHSMTRCYSSIAKNLSRGQVVKLISKRKNRKYFYSLIVLSELSAVFRIWPVYIPLDFWEQEYKSSMIHPIITADIDDICHDDGVDAPLVNTSNSSTFVPSLKLNFHANSRGANQFFRPFNRSVLGKI